MGMINPFGAGYQSAISQALPPTPTAQKKGLQEATFGDVPSLVNRYDQAASGDVFQQSGNAGWGEKFGDRLFKRARFEALTASRPVIDAVFPNLTHTQPFINLKWDAMTEKVKDSAVSYPKLFNMEIAPFSFKQVMKKGELVYEDARVHSLKDFGINKTSDFFLKADGRAILANQARTHFSQVLRPVDMNTCTSWKDFFKQKFSSSSPIQWINPEVKQGGFGLKGYLSKTVFADNVAGIYNHYKNGNWGGFGIRVFGIGAMLFSVFSNTHQIYQNAKAQEDGSAISKAKTLFKTATGFVGQAFKALAIFEISSIGFMIGAALIPVAGLPTILAGIAGAAVLSTVAYKGISYVIPDPPKKQNG